MVLSIYGTSLITLAIIHLKQDRLGRNATTIFKRLQAWASIDRLTHEIALILGLEFRILRVGPQSTLTSTLDLSA